MVPALLMLLNVIHVPALGEQIVNFTKIGIINNLRYSSSCYPDCFCDLLLEPSKAPESIIDGWIGHVCLGNKV